MHRLEAQDKMRTAFAGHIAQGSKCVANGPVSVCEKPKQVREKGSIHVLSRRLAEIQESLF